MDLFVFSVSAGAGFRARQTDLEEVTLDHALHDLFDAGTGSPERDVFSF
jgi:hypothetical protein